MTLSELRFIVAVGREKNFRRAAEKCFVSQPALSLAVKKLEEELGIALFERNRTEVRITQAGQAIINQSTLVLDEVAKIKEIAMQGDGQLEKPFTLGLIYSIAPYLLPLIIPLLRKSAPNMPLEIEENITKNLEEKEMAENARDALKMQIMNKEVELKNTKTEKYGRLLADVYCENFYINEWLVNERFAVKYDGGTKKTPVSWKKYKETGELN